MPRKKFYYKLTMEAMGKSNGDLVHALEDTISKVKADWRSGMNMTETGTSMFQISETTRGKATGAEEEKSKQ